MQHLRGIPHVWEEALRLWTARSVRSNKRGHGWEAASAKWRVLTLAAPYPLFYRRHLINPEMKPRLENPNPCLIWIQSKLGFQPLKCMTLWVYIHIDMSQVLLLAQQLTMGSSNAWQLLYACKDHITRTTANTYMLFLCHMIFGPTRGLTLNPSTAMHLLIQSLEWFSDISLI